MSSKSYRVRTLPGKRQKANSSQKEGIMRRFGRFVGLIPTQHRITESDLINAESRLGSTLFGPVPQGHRREFFRYQHNIWIYHESWTENGKRFESTITYEVRENGVYKLPLGGQYIKLEDRELDNFCVATKEYLKLVKAKMYLC